MPNYKTHSIHAEKVLPYIDKRIYIDKEKLKVFSFGPDCLLFSDIKTFNNQHDRDSKLFFDCLLRTIKTGKFQYNDEIMAFLYGQLEHFILDSTFHPYIVYNTSLLKRNYIADQHTTLELWLDDYFMNKYSVHDKAYYKNVLINDSTLKSIIDYVYIEVYKCYYASAKYNFGIGILSTLENTRMNDTVIPEISYRLGISDIRYNIINRIKPYLNTNRETWYHPYNLDEHHESINDVWNKSVALSLEVIEEVNAYLYDGKELRSDILNQNLSYDTGLPSTNEKKLILTNKVAQN